MMNPRLSFLHPFLFQTSKSDALVNKNSTSSNSNHTRVDDDDDDEIIMDRDASTAFFLTVKESPLLSQLLLDSLNSLLVKPRTSSPNHCPNEEASHEQNQNQPNQTHLIRWFAILFDSPWFNNSSMVRAGGSTHLTFSRYIGLYGLLFILPSCFLC